MGEKITEQAVLDALRAVKDPELKKDYVSLNLVQEVKICGGIVGFKLLMPTPSQSAKERMEALARQAVSAVPGVERVEIKSELDVPKGRGMGEKEGIPGVKNII